MAAVLIVSALVYLRSLGAGWIYDDHLMIVENRRIQDWSFFWKAFVHDSWWYKGPELGPPFSPYYRPLQLVWFELNYRLFGMHPVGWHAAMIALQVVVVWLVFRVAEELTDGDLWAAVAAALLFAVMPIHAQAVTWVSAVPLPMSAMFELSALLIIARRRVRLLTPRSIAYAVGFYVLALFCHESAVTLPFVIAAYILIDPRGDWTSAKDESQQWTGRVRPAARMIAPFIVAGVIYFGLRYLVLGTINRWADVNHMTVMTMILTLPEVVARYLLMLLAPFWSEPAHLIYIIKSLASLWLMLSIAGILAFAVCAYLVLAPRQRAPLYLFCVAWGAIAILPVLNIGAFRPTALVEDRYAYATSAAWSVLLGALAGEFIAQRGRAQKLALTAVGAVSAVLAVCLWRGQYIFHDDHVMSQRCVDNVPGSWICREWLAGALRTEGDYLDSDDQFRISIKQDPTPFGPIYDLGQLHIDEGDTRMGLLEMYTALKKSQNVDPTFFAQSITIAINAGDDDIAQKMIDLADTYPTGKAAAAVGRAELEIGHHNKEAAKVILEDVTRKFPKDGDAWILLADTYVDLGDLPDAEVAAGHAADNAPDAVWFRMVHARLLERLGRHDEAVAEYRLALAQEPNDPKIRKTVAQVAPEAIR